MAVAKRKGRKTPVRLELALVTETRSLGRDEASPVEDARLQQELRAAESAGLGPVPDFNRRFQVMRTDTPPAMDGRVNDPAWRKAITLKDFCVSQEYNEFGLPRYAADQTEGYVLYDDKGLYVGVRAYQDPASIYTTVKGEGLFRPDLDWRTGAEEWANTGCDEVEIQIDPELTKCAHYTFHVNPDGAKLKTYMPPARVSDGLYKRIDPVIVTDDRWQAAAARDDKGWTATAFIPYESFGFQPIRQVSQTDVYFNMVQDRTVMGFNINRVSHARREPSSWSRSKAPMFFRNADHFGHAYFRPLEAAIASARCADFLGGETAVEIEMRSQSDRQEDLVLKLAVTGVSKSTGETKLSLGAGESRTVRMAFRKTLPGDHRLDVRLTRPDGYLLDRIAYAFETPAPVEVTALRSILFSDESDFPVNVKVNAPQGSADMLRLRVLSKGKTIATARASLAAFNETAYPFEIEGLGEGEYEFEVSALKAGSVKGTGKAAFRVAKSPYQMKLTGTAGKRARTAKRLGFEALATGNAEGGASAPFGGHIAYLDGALASKACLWYAFTATDDFYTGGRGIRAMGGGVTPPRRAQLAAPIRAFAAGGEYEAVSLAIFALRDIKSVAVEFGELTLKSGAAISKGQMDLRVERPDRFLVKQEVLGGLAKGEGRRYLLTVYVAPGTPAGLYEGTITLTVDGASESRPWQLLVLPFALGPAQITASVYGGAYGDERDKPLMLDLVSHGMDNYTCFGVFKATEVKLANSEHIVWGLYVPTQERSLGNDPQKHSVDLDENVFRNVKKGGLSKPMIVDVNAFLRYIPCTQENAELFTRLVERIEALRKKHGLPEFIYHLVDEPNNHYTYDDGRYGRRWGILRVGFFGKVLKEMGLRQYVVINSTQHGYDIAEKVAQFCDIWCPNYIADEELIDRWSTGGREIWLYNYAGDGRCKGAMRSTYGFYARRVRAAGVTIWHHPSFVRYVPEEKKVLANSPWEAAREGIDDARYLAAAVEAIDHAQARGGRAARLAEAAAYELGSIIGAYPAATGEKVLFERKHDADQWNKWRWTFASWIMKLTLK
jgi:hypothetical protein